MALRYPANAVFLGLACTALALWPALVGAQSPAPAASPRRAAPRAMRRVPGKPVPHRPKLKALDERVVKQVVEMLTAYERRSVLGMRRFISGGFRSRDDMGFGQSPNQVELSFAGDFRNLRDIDFDVVINPPQYSADFRQARVDLQFNRRARFAVSGQEWIVRSQRTTMNFDVGGPTTRVSAVQGAPIMGLTNAVGVLVVDRGTVDGVAVNGPQPVLNGRFGAGRQDLLGFGNFRRMAVPLAAIVPPVVPPVAPAPVVPVPPVVPPVAPPPVVLLPDLTITTADITFLNEPPSAVFTTNGSMLRIFVRNIGNAPSAACNVRITVTNVQDAVTDTQTIPLNGLPAGGSIQVDLTSVMADNGETVTITAIADIDNVVAESSEGNNTGTRTAVVGP